MVNEIMDLFGGNKMDMRTYMMECLERHLSDYDLEGIELCDEDVDAVERLMKEKEMTLNNAVDSVLAGIYSTLA